MLLDIRKATRGWIAGIILGVLVVAFALWGVNDVFNGVGAANVAEVGSEKITPQQLTRQLDGAVRVERQRGGNVSRADAIEAGAHNTLLDQMIAQRSLWHYARHVGVEASHEQVADAIREFPNVQNSMTGGFDEAAYNAFLQDIGYPRQEFEKEIRGDITTRMLLEAMSVGARAPSSYGALLLAYQSELRTVSIAEIPMALAGNIDPPNEAQLQAFYEENAARLAVPEFRALTLVFASPDDFSARVDVPEARIQEEFEARRAGLTQPERRTAVQISAPDEAQATAAAQRLAAGEAPEAVASALGLQVVRYDQAARTEVPDSTIAEAVFATTAGQGPRAVRGRLTPWAAIQVTEITAETTPNIADIRDELRHEIAFAEAADLMSAAVSAFEDARSGGAGVADAARANGLRVVEIPAVSAQGLTPENQPVAEFAGKPDLLELAFETPEGEASDFLPAGDNVDMVLAVTRVIPESTRPLDEVRADLTEGWLARERMRRLQEISRELIASVNGGADFITAARAAGLNVVARSQQIDRQAASQLPAQRLGDAIYTAEIGQVVSDVRMDGGALVLGVVEAVSRTSPAEAPELVERGRQQIQQSLAQTIEEGVEAGARELANPRRNQRLIDRNFAPASADAAAS